MAGHDDTERENSFHFAFLPFFYYLINLSVRLRYFFEIFVEQIGHKWPGHV